MTMDQISWFKRDGDGFTIDVKVERMPGKPWTWQRIVAVACALADITREVLTSEPEGES